MSYKCQTTPTNEVLNYFEKHREIMQKWKSKR